MLLFVLVAVAVTRGLVYTWLAIALGAGGVAALVHRLVDEGRLRIPRRRR